MFIVKTLPDFDYWLDNIKDPMVQKRLATRLRKAAFGNLGDVKAVSNGVWEMREFFGSGWRMYYVQRGDIVIVMLGGGDKSSQNSDITNAIALAKNI